MVIRKEILLDNIKTFKEEVLKDLKFYNNYSVPKEYVNYLHAIDNVIEKVSNGFKTRIKKEFIISYIDTLKEDFVKEVVTGYEDSYYIALSRLKEIVEKYKETSILCKLLGLIK